jgi:DNA repair protein RecO (recombination protein O)
MAEQALALVVRGTDWSETSRITTLFTREFGKVRGLAKGGRRLRSNFEIAFDLLTVCNIVFLRKGHGGLDLLIEARVAERFPHLRTDLTALNIGYYVAELLSDGTQDYDPHPALFDAALGLLRALADPLGSGANREADSSHFPSLRGGRRAAAGGESPPDASESPLPVAAQPTSTQRGEMFQPASVDRGIGNATPVPRHPQPHSRHGDGGRPQELVSAFELVWLHELGYSPQLDECAVCQRGLPVPPAESDRVAYSPEAGGVVCPSCQPAARDRRPISAPAWAALKALRPDSPAPREPTSPLPPAVRREVRQVLGQTVGFVLGRRPRMLSYLDGT